MLIHMRAIGKNLANGRTRKRTAHAACPPRAQSIVVGVEDEIILRVKRLVARRLRKNHPLEKPGCMSQVPLGRAHVRHWLYHVVLNLQWLTQLARKFARAFVPARSEE